MLTGYVRTAFTYALLFIISQNLLHAQESSRLDSIENVLLEEFNSIISENLYNREKKAKNFYKHFAEVVEQNEVFNYPFDTLKNIGSIYSPDERLRVFTWNIPSGIDENLYYGIIQYYSKIDDGYRTVKLNDGVAFTLDKRIMPWHEALYYSITETKHAGQRYYTLLGFNLGTPLSNIKTVDVLSIDKFDDLYYTRNLFEYDRKKMDRLTFEYNEKAIMSLSYNDDLKMIVFDHLSPSKPSLEGKYEFYGPDFTYDGLKWEKGVWVHYSNIEVTN